MFLSERHHKKQAMLGESTTKNERHVTAEGHARQARICLEQSDHEFDKGDVLQASEKLWGATSHAIKAVADQRGWDHGKNSHRRLVVRRLAEEYEEFWLRAGYAAAEQFHANFYNNFMEDDAIEDYRPIVHELVDRLLNGSPEVGQQA